MPDLRTSDLERELSSPYAEDKKYLSDNASEMYCGEGTFAAYMRSLFKAHNTKPQIVFSRGDIPLRYGYRLISGEKHTRQRDVILRICFAADFSVDETQRALQIYGMSRLYARYPRDAVLIFALEHKISDISEINELLKTHGMNPLMELRNS